MKSKGVASTFSKADFPSRAFSTSQPSNTKTLDNRFMIGRSSSMRRHFFPLKYGFSTVGLPLKSFSSISQFIRDHFLPFSQGILETYVTFPFLPKPHISSE